MVPWKTPFLYNTAGFSLQFHVTCSSECRASLDQVFQLLGKLATARPGLIERVAAGHTQRRGGTRCRPGLLEDLRRMIYEELTWHVQETTSRYKSFWASRCKLVMWMDWPKKCFSESVDVTPSLASLH